MFLIGAKNRQTSGTMGLRQPRRTGLFLRAGLTGVDQAINLLTAQPPFDQRVAQIHVNHAGHAARQRPSDGGLCIIDHLS